MCKWLKIFPQYLLLIFSRTQNKPVPGFRSCCFAHIAQHYQMGSELISIRQEKYPFTQNINYNLNVKGKFLCSMWRQSGIPLCSDCRSDCETDCLRVLCDEEGLRAAHWGQLLQNSTILRTTKIFSNNIKRKITFWPKWLQRDSVNLPDLATKSTSWQQHWCSRTHTSG